jgi:hypothetical protein
VLRRLIYARVIQLIDLKNFAAATKRNLSPQDTDLIEITLTTILELDKLLHLLRDRSENLDLMSIRLKWEDHRVNAWKDRTAIIEDLQLFLSERGRWASSVYDNLDSLERTPQVQSHRRDSLASIKSVASDSSLASAGFSRSARFKLAEILSRDAAQFASRVTTLRHGHISAAGKAIDKFIDNSRKQVPDEFLDEQDKLEEKGINEMEQIGKFAMNVVMQWRK